MLTNIISGCCSEPAGRLAGLRFAAQQHREAQHHNTPFALSPYLHYSGKLMKPTNDASQPKLSEKTMPTGQEPRYGVIKPNSASTRERPFPAQRARLHTASTKAPMERDSELDQPAPISLRCDERSSAISTALDGDHIESRHCHQLAPSN